jgi:ERF superfamily
MTDQPASLAAALAELQTKLPRIAKATEGQAGPRRYKYADLADISAALLPLLGRMGLSFTAAPTLMEMGGEIKFVLHCLLRYAPSAECDEAFYPLGTGNPQQLGSAISYARRYALNAMTGLAPDDDAEDDALAAEQAARAQRNHAPETRADGSATDAELTRMSRGREPGAWRSDSTAENDPFYDQPAGAGEPGEPLAPAEDAPGSIAPQQLSVMHAKFAAFGIKDRAKRLEYTSMVLGRQVGSASELSYREAGRLLEAIEEDLSSTAKASR